MDKKVERIIHLYSRLVEGEVINKNKEAFRFGVNERTILRDIDDIRAYFANDMNVHTHLVYDRRRRGYRLECSEEDKLTGKEILAVCKILLESQALVKEELLPIVDKLLQCGSSSEERKKVVTLIANEKFHYKNPKNGEPIETMLWDIAGAVYEQRLMRICYQNGEKQDMITKIIQPIGIVFSDTNFYLTTYAARQDVIASSLDLECKDEEGVNEKLKESTCSTVYCMSQIMEYEVLEQHFHVPYGKRFGI